MAKPVLMTVDDDADMLRGFGSAQWVHYSLMSG